jgi:tetratricopeptide (TPR) repeat protein
MTVAADAAAATADPVDPHSVPSQNKAWTERAATPLLAILLAVATIALYAASLNNGFISYDDPAYVTNNRIVMQGLTRSGAIWAFTTSAEANWHPITWLSHMLDVQLFGMHPAGHHLMNVLLHAVNVVLLFLLLNAATKMRWRSALVAALFAVHPLNVETVAWIAERKSLISTAFFFLALGAYDWYVRRPNVGRYLAVALFFALGLMAKPMVITLPFVLLLLDYWPLERFSFDSDSSGSTGLGFRWRLVLEKVPLLLLSLASAAVTIYAQRSAGAIGSVAILPIDVRIKNAIASYLDYISKAAWPAKLAVFYPHPENALPLGKVLLSAIFLVIVSLLAWRARKQQRYFLTGWLWYLGTLVPVIGIIQAGRQAMADRYAYIPLIGIFVLVVWCVADWLPKREPWRAFEASLASVVLILFAVCSYRQIGFWHDSYSLFSHALSVTPDNVIAEDNLGTAYAERGFQQEAMQHYAAATRLTPGLTAPHYNLATMLLRANRLDDAQREYEIVVRNSKDDAQLAQTYNNLGILFTEKNQIAEALRAFDMAIQLNSGEVNSYIGRGTIEYQAAKFDAALADFSQAAQIGNSPLAYFWIGKTLEQKGDTRAAIAAYKATVSIAPAFSAAADRLQFLTSQTGNHSN